MNHNYLSILELEERISKLKQDKRMLNNSSGIDRRISDLRIKKDLITKRIGNISKKSEWQTLNYFRGLHSTEKGSPALYGILQPWFLNRTIRIYNQVGASNELIQNVIRGTQNALDQIGLNFKLEYCTTSNIIEEMISQSNNPNGKTNANTLGELLYNEPYRKINHGGEPHADIIIINNHNPDEQRVIPGSFGIGNYRKGYVVVWNGKEKVTTHEVGHLLGIPANHGERLMLEYSNEYDKKDIDSCVMNWCIPEGNYCDHCLDRLKYFWKGLEESTGIEYFK